MELMQYEIPQSGAMAVSELWLPDDGQINYFENDYKNFLPLNPDEKIKLTFKESVEISREKSSPIFKIYNFLASFESYEKDKGKNLFGNFYILDLDSFNSHFHFLNDQVGEYLAIKETIKDLKLLVVAKKIATNKKNLNDHNKTSKFIYDVLDKLEIFENKVINLNNYKSLSIDNLFATEIHFNKYLNRGMIFSANGNHPKTTVPALRKLFFNEKNITNFSNKKIFISRMNESNRIRQLRKRWDTLAQADQRTFKIFKSGLGNDLKIKILDRFISLSDEEELEKFFVKNGYEIINPGTYTFEEQIKIFFSATHVAGISGAAFINTIFCRPGTKVIILNTSNRYTFPHHRWPSEAGMKTLSVPEIIRKSNKDFSAKDIIDDISNRGIKV